MAKRRKTEEQKGPQDRALGEKHSCDLNEEYSKLYHQ